MENTLQLTKRCLVYGWATKVAATKTNKKISTAQEGTEDDNTVNKRRGQPSTGQKKRQTHWQIKLFLHRGINTLLKFSCTSNTICVHVTCMVLTIHGICGGLSYSVADLPFCWQEHDTTSQRAFLIVALIFVALSLHPSRPTTS